MAAEDGSNGAWHGDTAGHFSTFIASLFRVLAEQKVESPGITKARGFHRCTNVLIVNDKMLMKTLLQVLSLRYCFQQIKVFVIT